MLRAEETTPTLEIPTIGEKIQKALPIPLTETERRRRMICEVAEEIHPGCWSLDDPEPDVKQILEHYIRPIDNKICRCDDCSDSNSHLCKHNRNLPRVKRLIIHIPETTIRNSRGEEHHMRDFYIMIGLEEDYSKTLSPSMWSMRSTVTTEEYSCGAFHPHSNHRDDHTNLRNYFTWRGMCLGGDTELTDIMYTLFQDGISKKPLFELLVLLHVYASWESIEGGPYRAMRNYKYPRSDSRNNTLSFPSLEISNKTIEILGTTEEIAMPELVGKDDSLSISNVTTSLEPAIKLALLSKVLTGAERTTDRMSITCLQFLGTNTERGGFIPLYQGPLGTTKKSRDWYLNKIAQMEGFNKDYGDKVLRFNGKVNFQMILKEEGLEGANTEITDNQLQNATVHPHVVRLITTNYLDQFKQFKSLEKY